MIFSDILTELVCKLVPSRNFTLGSSRRKRPAWMNDKAITKIKKKKAVFERYKQTREWKDYLEGPVHRARLCDVFFALTVRVEMSGYLLTY